MYEGSLQPKIVAAVNDIRAVTTRGSNNDTVLSFEFISLTDVVISGASSNMGGVQEVCIRVTSAFRGGIWVVGRTLGERHIVFILKGCSTLNEVHDVVNRVLASYLGNILL